MNNEEAIAQRYYATIAEQGGADSDLDCLIFAPASEVDTGGLHILGEGINVILSE